MLIFAIIGPVLYHIYGPKLGSWILHFIHTSGHYDQLAFLEPIARELLTKGQLGLLVFMIPFLIITGIGVSRGAPMIP